MPLEQGPHLEKLPFTPANNLTAQSLYWKESHWRQSYQTQEVLGAPKRAPQQRREVWGRPRNTAEGFPPHTAEEGSVGGGNVLSCLFGAHQMSAQVQQKAAAMGTLLLGKTEVFL